MSQSNITSNNTMKVKVILGSDIRRWRYSKSESKLSSLNEFVSSSFNLNTFWLQYEDDEGDRLTLSSENDFEDAFACAHEQDRKSLKIYVIEGSIHNAQRKNSIHSQQQSQCQPDPECDVNKCFEIKALAIDFLSNPEINKLLPDLHRRIFEEIKKRKLSAENDTAENKENDSNAPKWDSPQSVEQIIRNILETEEKFKPIITHELYNKKLNGIIPCIAGKISSHLPILMNFSTEAIAAWIPHLASVLGHGFNTGFGSSFDMDLPSAMSSFFPLMCSFMSQHGDYSGLGGFCDDRDSNGDVIHYGVQCDECQTRPIKGARFKCCVCSNYDLCGQCESFNKHDLNHPMIKFSHSARNAAPPFMGLHEMISQFGHGPKMWFGHHWKAKFGRNRGGYGQCNRNKQQQQQSQQQQQNDNNNGVGFQPHPHPHPHGPPPPHPHHPGMGPPPPPHHGHPGMGHHGHPGYNWWDHHGHHRGQRGAWKRWNRWHQQQQQQNGAGNQWQQQQQGQSHGGNPWEMHNWQNWCDNRQNNRDDTSSVISSNIDINNKKEENKKIKVMADFVSDVTLPDRTYYPVDTVLTKTWKMKNNGEYEWGNNVELVFFKGNESLTLEKRYPVISAKPGQEVEVSAVIKTPEKPGRYCSYYRLQRNGEYFGPRVWVDIFAVDEEKEKKNTKDMNKNIEPKWKKYRNKGKNKGNNNKGIKQKQQDKMIKLEKREAKLEAKQLKLEAKQSKLASEMNNVSKQLDEQNENENSNKLIRKQEKLKKQQFKIKKQVEKIKNKSNIINDQQQKIKVNENDNNNNNKPIIIDEQQLLDDIANAAVKDLEFNEEQKQSIPPIQSIHPPSSAISCVCGATLHKTSPIQAYNNTSTDLRVNCDICGKFCPSTAAIYHCPNLKSLAHPEGYDLCCSCVEYQMQGFMPQQPIQPQPIQQQQMPVNIAPDIIIEPQQQQQQQAPKPEKKDEIFVYQQQLEQLRAMGFNDDEKIKAELIQQKGNVQRVANRLLQPQ